MNQRAVVDLSTFELWQQFALWTARHDRVLNPRWSLVQYLPGYSLFAGYRLRRDQKRLAVAEDRCVDITRELLRRRYRGILEQMKARGNASQPWEQALGELWQELVDECKGPSDPRDLPTRLWAGCENRLGPGIRPLKRRFMLRPYVDALPSASRDLLRALAYAQSPSSVPNDEETYQTLLASCAPLHRILFRQRRQAGRWTGEAITRLQIEAQAADPSEYLRWLFVA